MSSAWTAAIKASATLFVTNLPELIAASDVSDKAVLSSLAEAVVATLDAYTDEPSQQLVREFVRDHLMPIAAFENAFVTYVGKLTKANKAAPSGVVYTLCRWSCLLLERPALVAALKDEAAQADGGKSRYGLLVGSILLQLHLLHAASPSLDSGLYASALVAVRAALASLGDELAAAVLGDLVAKVALAGKADPAMGLGVVGLKAGVVTGVSLAVFAPMVAAMDRELFTQCVAATVSAFKRSVDAGFAFATLLVCETTMDLSAFARNGDGEVSFSATHAKASLGAMLLKAARHENDDVREEALSVFGVFVAAVSDPSVLRDMVAGLGDAVNGKCGSVSLWYALGGTARALGVVASAPAGSSLLAELAPTALAPLAAVLASNSNEKALVAVLRGAGPWLRAAREVPAEWPKLLTKFLSVSKNKKSQARLAALHMLHENMHATLAHGLLPLVPVLLEAVSAGMAKGKLAFPDAAVAGAVLMAMGKVDSSIEAETAAQVVDSIADGAAFDGSFVAHVATTPDAISTKISWRDLVAFASLVGALNTRVYYSQLVATLSPEQVALLERCLVVLALYPDERVQTAARDAMSVVVAETATTRAVFLSHFASVLVALDEGHLAPEALAARAASSSDGAAASSATEAPESLAANQLWAMRQAATRALEALFLAGAPAASELPVDEVVAGCVLAFSRLVRKNSWTPEDDAWHDGCAEAWNAVCAVVPGLDDVLFGDVHVEPWTALVQAMTGKLQRQFSALLFGSSPYFADAALHITGYIAAVADVRPAAAAAVLEMASSALADGASVLGSMTAKDVLIEGTPEGTLAPNVEQKTGLAAEVGASKASSKSATKLSKGAVVMSSKTTKRRGKAPVTMGKTKGKGRGAKRAGGKASGLKVMPKGKAGGKGKGVGAKGRASAGATGKSTAQSTMTAEERAQAIAAESVRRQQLRSALTRSSMAGKIVASSARLMKNTALCAMVGSLLDAGLAVATSTWCEASKIGVAVVAALSATIDPELVASRHVFAAAMLGAAGVSLPDEAWHGVEVSEARNTLMDILRATRPTHRYAEPTFFFLLPVLASVVKTTSAAPELRDFALRTALRCVSLKGALPRDQVLELCLYVVTDYPRMESAAAKALVKIAELVEPTEAGVLFETLRSPNQHIRGLGLRALLGAQYGVELTGNSQRYKALVYMATKDSIEANAALASELWAAWELTPEWEVDEVELRTPTASEAADDGVVSLFAERALIPLMSDPSRDIRAQVARAVVSSSLAERGSGVTATPEAFLAWVLARIESAPPVAVDTSASVKTAMSATELAALQATQSHMQAANARVREGMGFVLAEMGRVASLGESSLVTLLDYFLDSGLLDESEEVREAYRDAGVSLIKECGRDHAANLLSVLQREFDHDAMSAADDLRREIVVTYLSALVKHLPKGNPLFEGVFDSLMAAVMTPSHAVQSAVAKCLAKPAKEVKSKAQNNLEVMLGLLSSKETPYAERRGAAHALAGLVKGLGLGSIKQFGVMEKLAESVKSSSGDVRLGVYFAYECCAKVWGPLFEPYVKHALSPLLEGHAETDKEVRQMASAAAASIVSRLSAHGVKKILPTVLEAMDVHQWRARQGAIRLMGSLAMCAPKQLAVCLPEVVPRLAMAVKDSHPKVKHSGTKALEKIAAVVRNPEVSSVVPTLLAAYSEPTKCTEAALDALMTTSFVHRIDAPSLALIIPVVLRGLRTTKTNARTKSARIMGSLCTLASPSDLLPYMEHVMEELRDTVSDSSPAVRSVVAHAIGSLVAGVGEENFTDTVAWLWTETGDGSSMVARLGAAQALAEVIGSLGADAFADAIDELSEKTSSPNAATREGFLNVFVFIPPVLGDAFADYISVVLPVVLQGLADEAEAVRDRALKAGKVIVAGFAADALELLLPSLMEGLFDDDWRIRESSVELLGDLLFRLSGISGNLQVDTVGSGDEGMTNAETEVDLTLRLGLERRNKVFAALYMMRLDLSPLVRQASLRVWKQLVVNTGRMLIDVAPAMMALIIDSLSSANPDQRQIASRSLGDVVAKLGARVMGVVIPILRSELDSPDSDTRQGVCLGLSEVMASAPSGTLSSYVGSIVPAVKAALCDPSEDVREAAAQAYDVLYSVVGQEALAKVIPPMLAQVNKASDEKSEYALDGLRQILSVRSHVVLPYLLPKLVEPPLTAVDCQALATLSEVAGSALNAHLSKLLSPLMDAMASDDDDVASAAKQAAEGVVLAVSAEGVSTVLGELLDTLADAEAKGAVRENAAKLLAAFCEANTYDISSELYSLFRHLLALFVHESDSVVAAAWRALLAVTKSVDKDELLPYISHVRMLLKRLRVSAGLRLSPLDGSLTLEDLASVEIPGFGLRKGIDPLVPMLQQGLMCGSPELREASALGIGEVVAMTPPSALKAYVVKLTGPLIRVIGDRFPAQVKAAILSTLRMLLLKGGKSIKPFLPQLQTTLIKALNDPARDVRVKAATALGILIPLQSRVDPLLTELSNGVGKSEDDVKETMLKALAAVLRVAGAKMKAKTQALLKPTLVAELGSTETGVRTEAALALSLFASFLPADEAAALVDDVALAEPSSDWLTRCGAVTFLGGVVANAPELLAGRESAVMAALSAAAADDRAPIRMAAAEALGAGLYSPSGVLDATVDAALSNLVALLDDESPDVVASALTQLKAIARSDAADVLAGSLPSLAATMAELARGKSIAVKLAAERALLYLLNLHREAPESSAQFAAATAGQSGKTVSQYVTRVLAKKVGDNYVDSDGDDDGEDDGAGTNVEAEAETEAEAAHT
ncbi:uncharacterized protein AMSG_00448 [Thecamonas trahens ATCC 50062]|uniref:TOG domain-containing protein n=1 Tax=Thecamonas trahens ATCC 50062 TaxID=461836 RepID=A0A0L0D8W8_THETB|nr:hypothetical protein AMSG_00448 [Thecamonas trahens ATCC 50062]KNC48670.1 hypothetical protein AMSG_00448 [Thecamonas trahens ATCC 50062]|eukprot:XP_013762726.1 hypothetical protein AMSG_00448 [Thecamonas trahens ATCC 50062]